MNTMQSLVLSAAVGLLLAAGGCGNGVSAQSTAEVRKGAAEGAKRDAEALMDATYAKEQARKHAADGRGAGAAADAPSASADAIHAAALSRCDALPDGAAAPCRERADSELATAKARAEAAGSPGDGK